ncbi:MAG: ATP-binding protein [Candidatus Falkowbacteria bacterium]|nr:ATP-binding protein [Candidatus Falkowbacteria bacterium]
MSSKIFSTAVVGLDAEIVEVEAEMGGGQMGTFSVVGLPDIAVSESRERVRSAVKNSGLDFPRIKTTVNLAPADLRKQGPSYDLPIAISVLIAAGRINPVLSFNKFIFIGELALSGEVRAVSGVLSATICAQKKSFTKIFVPKVNAAEAALVPGIEVKPVETLREVINYLIGKDDISSFVASELILKNDIIPFDFSEVRGQEHVKRALEIAAAGAHNVFRLWTTTPSI